MAVRQSEVSISTKEYLLLLSWHNIFGSLKFYFRVSRTIFDSLRDHVVPHLERFHAGGKEAISEEKQLQTFLWYLVNQDSMREVANLFGLSISTVHGIVHRVSKAFSNHMMQVITVNVNDNYCNTLI
jgi:hypothetical protein